MGSLEDGQLQFILDRRLFQDDGRGMGEPLTDNANVEVREREHYQAITTDILRDGEEEVVVMVVAVARTLAHTRPFGISRLLHGSPSNK